MVSTATRLAGSWVSIASRIESLIWSAILSGWPSVTDSEVKRRRGTRHSLIGGWIGGPDWARPHGTLPAPTRRCAGARVRWSAQGLAGHLGRDDPPDPRGDGVLAAVRYLGGRAVGGQDDDRVVRAAEDLAGRDVVDDEQVAA